MADLRIRTIDEAEIDTLLSEDVEFEGELTFQDAVLVKGVVRGKIESSSDLFVSEQAHVDAEATAEMISVKGRLTGSIHARRKLELFSTGRIEGHVQTPDLIVQSGAVLNGSCRMDGAPKETD
ncbi:MAG: polymer-forming cytoskeletal family protein [Spirochaetaceae bacterium]|nr:MAG: polymer-forming cytoskeletal family protein [Spirochaetaceae bacterium]